MDADTTKIFLSILQKCFDNAKNIQALVATVATVVAGIWAYFGFIRKRLKYPKVNASVEIESIQLKSGHFLIRAQIKIENMGEIIIKSDNSELRLRQIKPISRKIFDDIENNRDPVERNNSQIAWPCIVQRQWKFIEIEPKETDVLHADFFIKNEIETIELYFFMQNNKKRKGVGWTVTKIFNIPKEFEMENNRNKELNEQQKRQQEQQQQQQQQQEKKEENNKKK
ncbi:MAG: hypothetical protein ACOCQ4_02760 [bacterium]